ncbi:MAG TPA: peptidoglycan editing factor PgeF [Micropepsaceae bacterium]|nr:peptidoglycan editing factor PgeF [Micropepsaceae bacterium]
MLKITSKLLALPGVAHGFFGRRGGVSTGIYASLNCGPGSGDERDAVMENRKRAIAALGAGSRLVTLYQVHSAEAIAVDEPWDISANPKADGMVTQIPGVALGILTADCAPVLLFDAQAKVIGAAHAGWQGAFSGIVESVLAAMARLGAETSRVQAAVGPCIGQAAYEVGPEFHARFVAADAENGRFFRRPGPAAQWHFDLPAYVAHRLTRAGARNVDVVGRCTYAEEQDFFSYRRTTHRKERDYGRQLSVIALSG